MQTKLDDLRYCMMQVGLEPPANIIADGEIHRFSSNGKPGDDAGWYVVRMSFSGREPRYYGAFGDWRSGSVHTWVSHGEHLSFAERESLRAERQAAMKRERADRQRRHEQAEAEAADLLTRAAFGREHPYLRRKGLPADDRVAVFGDELLIPMNDAHGSLVGLQRIWPDGTKRYLPGTRAAGAMFVMHANPSIAADSVMICEGYATGRSAELCGLADIVVVAFSKDQLKPAALAMRRRLPRALLWVLADNDCGTPGNPGKTAALDAAREAGGRVMLPVDGAGRCDFNDLWCRYERGAHSYLLEVSE